MKKIFSALIMFVFISCSSNTNNTTTTKDSANAIEEHPLQDSVVSHNPDGYTPPNTKVDTSKRLKDSMNARQH